MKYFTPASEPALVSLWKATMTYIGRLANSSPTNNTNKFIDIATIVIPSPEISINR